MRSFKPDNGGYRSDAPFDDETTNKNDYKKWDVHNQLVKKDNEWHKPQGEMDLNTNYANEFTGKQGQRAQAIRPVDRARTDAKFDGGTTYHEDFRTWGGEKRGLIRASNEYQPPTQAFEGQSTYKGHYVGHDGGPASSFKPSGQAYSSGMPFDGTTLYRTEFTPKEVEPCPAALLETNRAKHVFAEESEKGHRFYQPTNLAKPVYAL